MVWQSLFLATQRKHCALQAKSRHFENGQNQIKLSYTVFLARGWCGVPHFWPRRASTAHSRRHYENIQNFIGLKAVQLFDGAGGVLLPCNTGSMSIVQWSIVQLSILIFGGRFTKNHSAQCIPISNCLGCEQMTVIT